MRFTARGCGSAAGLLGDFGAAACPRPMGDSPPAAGAAAGRRPRYRQAGGTGRNGSRSAAPARIAGPSSGRRAVSHRSKITIKGAPSGASLTRWRKRHP